MRTVTAILSFVFAFLMTISVKAEVVYATPLQVNGEEFEIGNLLVWSTSFEQESAHFYIEKSLDGLAFENIGKVEAAGNSLEELKYRYMDIQPTEKMAFYRLREVDINGTESFSHTVKIEKALPNQFMIINYSNVRVKDMFVVTIDALVESSLDYAVYTYKGEALFEGSQAVNNGLNNFEINLADEKEGIYKVVFQMGVEKEVLNILKTEDPLKKKPNVASKRATTGG